MTVDIRSQLPGYSDDELDSMAGGMKDGEGIKLPFPHLVIWAANGDRKMKQMATTSPTAYFGGWNLDHDLVQELGDTKELKTPLDQTGWLRTQKEGREGAYTVYETRVLHMAPICKRFSWLSKDGKSRTPDYDAGHSRSHLQVLCLIGAQKPDGILYVAPAIVSVKGKGQTTALNNALKAWETQINANRQAMNAKGFPLFAWWQSIGTSGEPNFVSVGPSKDSSDITPVKAVMATDKLTPEQMGKRFVGPDCFQLAKILLQDAKPWREAWKSPAESKQRGQQAPPPGDAYEGPPDDSYHDDGNNIPY